MSAESGNENSDSGEINPQSAIPNPQLQRGRIGGVDYGTVRIGVAIGDLEVGMASPHENYNRRSERLDAEYFATLARRQTNGKRLGTVTI